MSQKKGKNKSKGSKHKKQGGDDSYGLQAIILADSYRKKRFRPITHCIPKMLIPLAGCPMIDYSIDLLINSNVNEIYIICSSHSEQLEQYIHSSQWMNKRWFPKLKIHIESVPSCHTVGAALRHMHTLNYIQSKTFVLCHGDCIANISLSDIIKSHQKRFQTSTDALMTCLFKKAHYKQRSTSLEDDLFIVTNHENELLQYSNDHSKSDLSFDLSIFDDHDEIAINHNLIDCGIDICSKTVLSLFEDNFDYESIRKELFEGVIRSEIYRYKIYVALLCGDTEYAARILDWRSYAGITFDIIERWTYPLVLDSNTVSHNYLYQRNNIYKEDNVKIGLQSQIKKSTLLGYNTNIGNKCEITKSVIGPNCTIGHHCSISNSFMFGDCTIADHTVLNGAVIANNVMIGKHCNVPKGCILSYGVEIDNEIRLRPYTKLTLKRTQDDDEDDGFGAFDSDDAMETPCVTEIEKTTIMGIIDQPYSDAFKEEYDTEVVGLNGKGYAYEIRINDASYVLDSINNVMSTYADRPQRGWEDEEEESKMQCNVEEDTIHIQTMSDLNTPIGNGNEIESDLSADMSYKGEQLNLNKLVSEISECVESAENNASINMDDVVFEITTSVRLSHNAQLQEFSVAVFVAILSRIQDDASMQSKQKEMEYYMTRYCCLFTKLAKKEEDQIKVIIGLYTACNTRQKGLIYYFLEGLDKLFYEDTVALESIQKWNEERKKSEDDKFEQYLTQYIDGWIDAEESDDEDDDDEDEDDDDDEESD